MTEQNMFMTTMTWGANLTEKALGVPLGAVRTIREEMFRATFAGIDWMEGINHSYFKVVRETFKRMDHLSQEAVDGLDSVAGSFSRIVRGSGEAAGEMVSRTAASLAGMNETSPKQAIVASA